MLVIDACDASVVQEKIVTVLETFKIPKNAFTSVNASFQSQFHSNAFFISKTQCIGVYQSENANVSMMHCISK